MSYSFIYLTCASEEEAKRIAEELLVRNLIACANVMAPHVAVYRWEGEIEHSEEVSVLLKTRTELFEKVREAICALHSYECPCIVSWPVGQGHTPFLDWIGQETQG